MATVGTRPIKDRAKNYENDPLRVYAESFCNTVQQLNAQGVELFTEAARAYTNPDFKETLKDFFIKESYSEKELQTPEMIEEHMNDMEALFENDMEGIMHTVMNEATNMSTVNPMIGFSVPMHKLILMNMVFDKVIPNVVANTPQFTITMENRYLIDTEGNKIDMYREQHKLTAAIDATVKTREIDFVDLPVTDDVDIVHDYLGGLLNDNLDISTKVCAVKVPDVYFEVGDILPDEQGYIRDRGQVATEATTMDVWFGIDGRFSGTYGPIQRSLMYPFSQKVKRQDAEGNIVFVDVKEQIMGSMHENRLNITTVHGTENITGIRVRAKLDPSTVTHSMCSVTWDEETKEIVIPPSIPINTTVKPEEVKDIAALYNVNQVTKLMSLMKTPLVNYKDDKIKQGLDESYINLPTEWKDYKEIDWAPRAGYAGDHRQWRHDTFFDAFDSHVQTLLQVLNDPNVTISVVGQADIIRKITPTDYSYQVTNMGPVTLDYAKTVYTSDNRQYSFVSSDKMRMDDELIVVLNPRNTNRFIYRLYDYQMYIGNEIRNPDQPALPAIHAFERFLFEEYQPVQGRIKILHKDGIVPEAYDAFPVRIRQ